MKKKFISLCLVAVFAATAAIGGTLAYFTDTDTQKNTFTVGNVAIDLWEDFGTNSGIEKLIPATGSAQQGTLKNGVDKYVYVDNTGSEDAYVRVHIAIPHILDDGDPSFDAGKNVLHFNYASDTIGEGKWDWSKAADDGKYDGNWNYYETTINGVPYNVYVVTYTAALKNGETTVDAMHQVYLDSKVTNEDIAKIIKGVEADPDKQQEAVVGLGNNWYIYVVAEGCQTEGFSNAYEALNASFGTPGSTGYKVPDFTAASEGKTFQAKTVTPDPTPGEGE